MTDGAMLRKMAAEARTEAQQQDQALINRTRHVVKAAAALGMLQLLVRRRG